MKHFFAPEDSWENIFPTIMPQWDRTPRANVADGIYVNATPQHFREHIEQALKVVKDKEEEHKILFLRSWNEWGEGNYMEPDLTYGKGYICALREALNELGYNNDNYTEIGNLSRKNFSYLINNLKLL